jgi:hypothetical protein
MVIADECVLAKEWVSAGLANATASAALNPIDVTKTRLQAFNVSAPSQIRIWSIVNHIYSERGLLGLWKPGLSASMAREMLYSGPRAGFYVPLRNQLQRWLAPYGDGENGHHLATKLCAALITGNFDLFTRL